MEFCHDGMASTEPASTPKGQEETTKKAELGDYWDVCMILSMDEARIAEGLMFGRV